MCFQKQASHLNLAQAQVFDQPPRVSRTCIKFARMGACASHMQDAGLLGESCHKKQAPMWVVRVQDVLSMKGKPQPHQELKQRGLLWLREHTSLKSWVMFVSHQWLGRSHPDPNGEQLQVLQDVLRQLIVRRIKIEYDLTTQTYVNARMLTKAECHNLQHAYVWLDWFCVPQMVPGLPTTTREEQLNYIFSIPYYVDSCELFVALVPRCLHETGEPVGESTWLQRGWCRTEMWCKVLLGPFL